jgi:hypothetical protein
MPSATSEGWDIEINWTKLLVGVAVLLLLGGGTYFIFFFFDGGFGKPKPYPTEGVVLYKGKPAVGARVTLFPEKLSKQSFFPTGVVKEDGTFKLTTYAPDDGAPAGNYQVTVMRGQMDRDKYDELSKKYSPQEIAQIAQRMTRDPLYSKYATPGSSGLKAEIKNTTNRLELNLD